MRYLIVILTLVLTSASLGSNYLEKFKTLSSKEAKAKWGSTPFNKDAFRLASKNGYNSRLKMVSEIIGKQLYKGESIKKLTEDLGAPQGYFISDVIPSYILFNPKQRGKESWQLVFEPDNSGLKVERVMVYKTCCSTY